MDYGAQHPLSRRHGWNLAVAGDPDDFFSASMRAHLLALSARPHEGIPFSPIAAGDGDDRSFCRLRPVFVLLLLGSNPHPDGAADRHVWAPAARLCRSKVLSVYRHCFGLHAGGDSVVVCEIG